MNKSLKMASDSIKYRERLDKQKISDAKYHNEMRSKGFKRINIWVKEKIIDQVKIIVDKFNREEK